MKKIGESEEFVAGIKQKVLARSENGEGTVEAGGCTKRKQRLKCDRKLRQEGAASSSSQEEGDFSVLPKSDS